VTGGASGWGGKDGWRGRAAGRPKGSSAGVVLGDFPPALISYFQLMLCRVYLVLLFIVLPDYAVVGRFWTFSMLCMVCSGWGVLIRDFH
jgi:hypothetical protein